MMRPLLAFLLVASAVRAQADPPTVGLLGCVEKGRIPWQKDMTLLDVVLAAKPQAGASLATILLLRGSGREVLAVEIDVGEIVGTGLTHANLQINAGDLIVVPTEAQSKAAKDDGGAAQAVLATIEESKLSFSERVLILGWRLQMAKDVAARQQIVAELGKLGAHAAGAVPCLVNALEGALPVAREAATALGMIGAPAKLALPALDKLVDAADVGLRARARAAAAQIRAALAAAVVPPPRTK